MNIYFPFFKDPLFLKNIGAVLFLLFYVALNIYDIYDTIYKKINLLSINLVYITSVFGHKIIQQTNEVINNSRLEKKFKIINGCPGVIIYFMIIELDRNYFTKS